MLISVIQFKNESDVKQQIEKAKDLCDAFEFRFDYALERINISLLKKFRSECSLPVIFTLRKKSQGGYYVGEEKQRLQDIESLCTLFPDFLDLEYDTDSAFIKKIHTLYPNIKMICSYHNFEQTPQDLQSILQHMIQPEFALYKIATFAKQTCDALRMLFFVRSTQDQHLKISGICMGIHGAVTRILGPVVGNMLNFAPFNTDEVTAPGQLSLEDLNQIFYFRNLNTDTKIYALLGDPIEKSLGHILHNQLIRAAHKNAVYVKLKSSVEELPEILKLCKELNFLGFSVTMPLKESIISYLKFPPDPRKKINAVNTIVVSKQGYLSGFNTDGEGAIRALKSSIPQIKDLKIVILGAGGAGQAIAQAAIEQGAHVWILNRTESKAVECAKMLGCQGQGLSALAQLKQSGYSVLINTLPFETLGASDEEVESIVSTQNLIPGTVVMDIVYNPAETRFLKKSKQAGCICIPGTEMFVQQALLQAQLWEIMLP